MHLEECLLFSITTVPALVKTSAATPALVLLEQCLVEPTWWHSMTRSLASRVEVCECAIWGGVLGV